MKRKNLPKMLVKALLSIIIGFIVLFPYLFMFVSAFKNKLDLFEYDRFFFFTPSLENFEALVRDYNIINAIGNSLVYVLASVAGCMALSSLAAYALSRYKFKGRESLALDIMTLRILPPVVAVIPIYVIFQMLGLFGTHLSLIIVYIAFNLPLGIWLTKTYFDELLIEVEEAATLDGCNKVKLLTSIVLPMSISGLTVTAFLLGIFIWNEFLFASILTTSSTRTVTVAAAMTIKQRFFTFGDNAACAVFVTLPMLIVFLIVEKYLMRALTFGMVK